MLPCPKFGGLFDIIFFNCPFSDFSPCFDTALSSTGFICALEPLAGGAFPSVGAEPCARAPVERPAACPGSAPEAGFTLFAAGEASESDDRSITSTISGDSAARLRCAAESVSSHVDGRLPCAMATLLGQDRLLCPISWHIEHVTGLRGLLLPAIGAFPVGNRSSSATRSFPLALRIAAFSSNGAAGSNEFALRGQDRLLCPVSPQILQGIARELCAKTAENGHGW